jgi:hypothetical protein
MKKILAILLILVMILTLMAACNNNEDGPDQVVVPGDATPAEFNASTYLIDSWREDASSGDRVYYITLFMYSKDYYACPTTEDIKYKTDDGYVPLTESVEGTEITMYHLNAESKKGVCAYAKIATPILIDTKKIYVNLAGPSEYNENTLTEEAYQASNGSLEGWRALLTNVSTNDVSSEVDKEIYSSKYYGILRLYDDYRSQYYCSSITPIPIVHNERMVTKIEIDPLTENASMETLVEHVTKYGQFAMIDNDVVTTIELDERLNVVCEVIDGELWVGFETVDGSNIDTFDGEIPDAIAYPHSNICYLAVK